MADFVNTITAINAQTIAASGSYTSAAIPVTTASGFNSLQWAVTGSGTCKFEVLVSLDDSSYIDSTEVADLATGITASTGNGSDGKDVVSINIPVCTSFKIKCTETGTSNSVTVTAIVGQQ